MCVCVFRCVCFCCLILILDENDVLITRIFSHYADPETVTALYPVTEKSGKCEQTMQNTD